MILILLVLVDFAGVFLILVHQNRQTRIDRAADRQLRELTLKECRRLNKHNAKLRARIAHMALKKTLGV